MAKMMFQPDAAVIPKYGKAQRIRFLFVGEGGGAPGTRMRPGRKPQ